MNNGETDVEFSEANALIVTAEFGHAEIIINFYSLRVLDEKLTCHKRLADNRMGCRLTICLSILSFLILIIEGKYYFSFYN